MFSRKFVFLIGFVSAVNVFTIARASAQACVDIKGTWSCEYVSLPGDGMAVYSQTQIGSFVEYTVGVSPQQISYLADGTFRDHGSISFQGRAIPIQARVTCNSTELKIESGDSSHVRIVKDGSVLKHFVYDNNFNDPNAEEKLEKVCSLTAPESNH